MTGSLEFVNGNLLETAWFKTGLVKKLGGVLCFTPCTAGGLAAWMFTVAPVFSIVLLLSVRLWFCVVVFGEEIEVFSISLASVKATEGF